MPGTRILKASLQFVQDTHRKIPHAVAIDTAAPSIECRCQWPRGLRRKTCWDCWFESRQSMDICLLEMLCCQVEVSATGRSLIWRNPDVLLCEVQKLQEQGGPRPSWTVAPEKEERRLAEYEEHSQNIYWRWRGTLDVRIWTENYVKRKEQTSL